MKHLTRKELIERLRTIANDEIEITERMGAMCYSPKMPFQNFKLNEKCEYCGNEAMVWDLPDKWEIRKKVQVIKELGYDAKLEILCSGCLAKLKTRGKPFGLFQRLFCRLLFYISSHRINYQNYVFLFKTKEQKNYNITVAKDIEAFDAVIAFLKNEKIFIGKYGEKRLVKEKLHIIKMMTGISIN